MSHGGFASSGRAASNTNDAIWKLLFGAAGLFAGLYLGASMPGLVFKHSPSHSPSAATASDTESETDTVLCAGPECVTMPPPKVPTNGIAVTLPSAYHSTRLSLLARTASTTAEIANIERFAFAVTILAATHAHSQSLLAKLHGENYSELEPVLSVSEHSIKSEVDMTMTTLKSHIAAGRPVIAKIQSSRDNGIVSDTDSNDSESVDWLHVTDSSKHVLVIGYDSFYIYCVDNFVSGAIVFCPTREFSRRWHSLDARGERVTGEATMIQQASTSAAVPVRSKSLTSARLVQLQ